MPYTSKASSYKNSWPFLSHYSCSVTGKGIDEQTVSHEFQYACLIDINICQTSKHLVLCLTVNSVNSFIFFFTQDYQCLAFSLSLIPHPCVQCKVHLFFLFCKWSSLNLHPFCFWVLVHSKCSETDVFILKKYFSYIVLSYFKLSMQMFSNGV